MIIEAINEDELYLLDDLELLKLYKEEGNKYEDDTDNDVVCIVTVKLEDAC